jgi:hypothetical protein
MRKKLLIVVLFPAITFALQRHLTAASLEEQPCKNETPIFIDVL